SNELQQEAFLVSIVLKDLKSTFEAMNDPRTITRPTNTLNDTVIEFSKTMADMECRIGVKEGELIKQLKWPFTEKENEKYLSRLERYKSTFVLALSTVQRYIIFNLFSIETDVSLQPTVTTD